MKDLRIHAIILALNEADFIEEAIKPIYNVCSGISVITQFDRDYYGNKIDPDKTVEKVLKFPDPEGKIHLVIRRFKDETAARNHEMLSILGKPHKGIIAHGVSYDEIATYYKNPDYFLIVDADEIYDQNSIGNIVDYLNKYRPRGMRVTGKQYLFTWNQLIPQNIVHHHHFGFIKAGLLFQQRRVITWNEFRLRKFLKNLQLDALASQIYDFIDCPQEVGVFHHGSYLGGEKRLLNKFKKHSHPEIVLKEGYLENIKNTPFNVIESKDLPQNIKNGNWPMEFFDQAPPLEFIHNVTIH
jgi:hypothetical protein